MKRLRCPKCSHYITFDDTKYKAGQTVRFHCQSCGHDFGIRLGRAAGSDMPKQDADAINGYGSIVVLENACHYRQEIPLHYGDNIIGRYMKGSPIQCPIETDDMTVDMTHCILNVSKKANGKLKYTLRDYPSYGGTFVDNRKLGVKEQRVIDQDSMVTIGHTSILLKPQE